MKSAFKASDAASISTALVRNSMLKSSKAPQASVVISNDTSSTCIVEFEGDCKFDCMFRTSAGLINIFKLNAR